MILFRKDRIFWDYYTIIYGNVCLTIKKSPPCLCSKSDCLIKRAGPAFFDLNYASRYVYQKARWVHYKLGSVKCWYSYVISVSSVFVSDKIINNSDKVRLSAYLTVK